MTSDAPLPLLRITRLMRPPTARLTPHFSAIRLDRSVLGSEVDPFMSLDHFRMAAPTFPPHPHAGFSAVTYVLPESKAGMFNRDSLGDRSRIVPGGLHWTAAGSGIVHEEVPDPPGETVEGFQIFVKQPAAQETLPPRIEHVPADDMPHLSIGDGSWLRVLAGTFGEIAAPFAAPSELLALDLALTPHCRWTWMPSWPDSRTGVYLFAGSAEINGHAASAPTFAATEHGPGRITIAAGKAGARLLVLSGRPLALDIYTNGPFAMSSPQALERAVERFRAGAMGQL